MDTMFKKIRDVHLIELHGVSRSYASGAQECLALDRVDLEVAPGEFVAVVGKSGSGKSTLINLVAGIDRPSAGTLRVCGADIGQLDEGQLAAWRGKNVGVVFQFFQLLPTLTILENVILPMDFCGTRRGADARRQAMSLLERMGIADQANKLPAMLSGGQQQRAAIARALANDPPLIVADEPTGNLDTRTADAVLASLAELTDANKTVLMVTHERDVAQRVDRVITVADGHLLSDERGRRPHPHEQREAADA